MEFVFFLLLVALVLLFVLPSLAVGRANRAQEDVRRLTQRLAKMEDELLALRLKSDGVVPPPPEAAPYTPPPLPSADQVEAAIRTPPPAPPSQATPVLRARPSAPLETPRPSSEVAEPLVALPTALAAEESLPPPSIPPPAPPPVPDLLTRMRGELNWEQFMGAKLFAWIGGLALFLGVAYFVKYSFDHDLIPPGLRVALGMATGLALIGGGLRLRSRTYAITAHALCATGVLVLYAATFAGHAVYHLPGFGSGPAFVGMALITAAAFGLAMRLDARVVAILGLVGGFLTPHLLSTGRPPTLALFGYVGVLYLGLLAVAVERRWKELPLLGALGVFATQWNWLEGFLPGWGPIPFHRFLQVMLVLLAFLPPPLLLARVAQRRGVDTRWFLAGGAGLGVIALLMHFHFLHLGIGDSGPEWILASALLMDVALLAMAGREPRLHALVPAGGGLVLLLLANWILNWGQPAPFVSASAFILVAAGLHTLVPALLARRGGPGSPLALSIPLFPPVGLLLLIAPVLHATGTGWLVWPFLLVLNGFAAVGVLLSGAASSLLISLLLTFVALALRIDRISASLPDLRPLLGTLAVFTVGLTAITLALRRRREPGAAEVRVIGRNPAQDAYLLSLSPLLSTLLPFGLLVLMCAQTRVADPSPIFLLALGLAFLAWGVAAFLRVGTLPPAALLGVAAVEFVWHGYSFNSETWTRALGWYLVFHAGFTAAPFALAARFRGLRGPWLAGALAGVAQFVFVVAAVQGHWPPDLRGLLPALFALPAALALWQVRRRPDDAADVQLTRLALYSGALLFFITVIFPMQWGRQWLTLGWTLEGVALCALYHRIPHPGLRAAGVALLVVAFARLALNPAVLSYHARGPLPLLNWYLYAYGLVTVCLCLAARLLAPPRHQVGELRVDALLWSLGAITGFLLVNIEIADFFTAPGARTLVFQFSGSFGRDMTYSIAWALFALLLMGVGLARRVRPARLAGLGLLAVTLAKLFLHDLANLHSLYRIGALVGVAVVAMLASALYQRANARGGGE